MPRKSIRLINFERKLAVSGVVPIKEVEQNHITDYEMKKRGFTKYEKKEMWIHHIKFEKFHRFTNKKCNCSVCIKAREEIKE